jgi:hypothetical protein
LLASCVLGGFRRRCGLGPLLDRRERSDARKNVAHEDDLLDLLFQKRKLCCTLKLRLAFLPSYTSFLIKAANIKEDDVGGAWLGHVEPGHGVTRICR